MSSRNNKYENSMTIIDHARWDSVLAKDDLSGWPRHSQFGSANSGVREDPKDSACQKSHVTDWEQISENYIYDEVPVFPQGSGHQAVTAKALSYRVSVRLRSSLEGLIPLSEISQAEGTSLPEIFSLGFELKLRILHVEVLRQHLGSSMRIE